MKLFAMFFSITLLITGGCGFNPTEPTTAGTEECTLASDCPAGDNCINNKCVASNTCTDAVKNGVETDTDCGGGTCPKCGVGKACVHPSDCASALCINAVCAASDGGALKPNGTACTVDTECVSGHCISNVCGVFTDGGGTSCGNGVCEVSLGETKANCPGDCPNVPTFDFGVKTPLKARCTVWLNRAGSSAGGSYIISTSTTEVVVAIPVAEMCTYTLSSSDHFTAYNTVDSPKAVSYFHLVQVKCEEDVSERWFGDQFAATMSQVDFTSNGNMIAKPYTVVFQAAFDQVHNVIVNKTNSEGNVVLTSTMLGINCQ